MVRAGREESQKKIKSKTTTFKKNVYKSFLCNTKTNDEL